MSVLLCVSDRFLAEEEGWERVAGASLAPADSTRSRFEGARRTWRLPPQPRLPRGGHLALVSFDGSATCEAARSDPRALVVGVPGCPQGAIRLPDNAQHVDVEVLDGGGARRVVLVRAEVWRGWTGLLVATWDPEAGSVDVVLDSWRLPPGDYGCKVWGRGSEFGSLGPFQRREFEGVVLDLVRVRRG